MSVEKSLGDKFLDLLQVPAGLAPSFTGDTVATDGLDGNIKAVRPNPVTYLPMQIELLGPKVAIDIGTLQQTNLALEAAANETGSELGRSEDLVEAAEDYLMAVQTMEFLEPLVFYINPNNLTRTYARKTSEQFAGGGHVVEHSGQDQDRLSASGKIGAYYTDKTGLTRFFRRNSASFQQLMHLYLLYRNNGYVYEITDAHRISLVGRVQITFDTEVWVGHFDSFQMSEDANNPYTMDYSFEFTVREYTNDETLR